MKLLISHKLVLALLALTLLVLVATLGLAHWSFERGFLDYVNALEQIRLERIRDNFANEYEASGGNWESLTPKRFARIMQDARWEQAPHRPPRDQPPPPDFHQDGPPRGFNQEGPPGGFNRIGPPTAVYDKNNVYVAGDSVGLDSDSTIRVAIMVGEGVVGELRSEPRRDLVSPQETAFSEQQTHASWMIGLVSLALAVLVSLLLARGLLAPVRRMITDVRQLSDGNYSVRIGESRADELGQLMGDIDRLANILEETQSSRRRWFADISHELRTPITILSGELEGLRDGVLNFDQQQVASLSQEVERMRHLVDDLFELSLADVGGLKYSFSPCDLGDVLGHNVDSVRARAKGQGIDITLNSTSIVINADEKRLSQLFQNLFENSLAYTDGPGQIDIRLFLENQCVVVEIQDTPPGVSSADCERLFEPLFRQEISRSRRYGGAGLGLSICRKIVEAHDGTINASPSPLGGLTIRTEFPLSCNS